MLGLRGCRLGLVYPELNVMQVKAIAGATADLIKQGFNPKPEIMIPLVGFEAEIEIVRAIVEENVRAVSESRASSLTSPSAP